eukprot:7506066-Prorocentrum_lima.AAC.1
MVTPVNFWLISREGVISSTSPKAQFDIIRQAMMTKKGKSKMSLTKAWWMEKFVHVHGTSLKSAPK